MMLSGSRPTAELRKPRVRHHPPAATGHDTRERTAQLPVRHPGDGSGPRHPHDGPGPGLGRVSRRCRASAVPGSRCHGAGPCRRRPLPAGAVDRPGLRGARLLRDAAGRRSGSPPASPRTLSPRDRIGTARGTRRRRAGCTAHGATGRIGAQAHHEAEGQASEAVPRPKSSRDQRQDGRASLCCLRPSCRQPQGRRAAPGVWSRRASHRGTPGQRSSGGGQQRRPSMGYRRIGRRRRAPGWRRARRSGRGSNGVGG